MKLFCGSVRENNAEITFGVTCLSKCGFPLSPLLKSGAVFWMNPVEEQGHGGSCCRGVISKNSEHLLGPKHLVGTQIPGPASAAGHSLRFCQIAFTTPKSFFAAPALCNVCDSSDKLHTIAIALT